MEAIQASIPLNKKQAFKPLDPSTRANGLTDTSRVRTINPIRKGQRPDKYQPRLEAGVRPPQRVTEG